MQCLGAISKWQSDLCLFPRQTIQYHSNRSLCTNYYSEEAEVEWFYDELQDLLRTNTKNISPFDHRGLEYRSRITGKFGLGVWNETGQRLITVLPREHTSQQTPTSNNTTDNLRWHHQMIKPKSDWLYIICSWRWRSFIQLAKTRPGADYGSLSVNSLPNSDLNWRT